MKCSGLAFPERRMSAGEQSCLSSAGATSCPTGCSRAENKKETMSAVGVVLEGPLEGTVHVGDVQVRHQAVLLWAGWEGASEGLATRCWAAREVVPGTKGNLC